MEMTEEEFIELKNCGGFRGITNDKEVVNEGMESIESEELKTEKHETPPETINGTLLKNTGSTRVICHTQLKICYAIITCGIVGMVMPILINIVMPVGTIPRKREYFCDLLEGGRVEALRGYAILSPEVCSQRKCCWWLPNKDFSSPACYHRFPSAFGYFVRSTNHSRGTHYATLETLPESEGKTPYLTPMTQMLEFSFETVDINHSVLRVGKDGVTLSETALKGDVELLPLREGDYFRFLIKRKSSNEILLNSISGPFIYSADYIEFSIDLPDGRNTYGLGGNSLFGIKIPFNRERLTLFTRKGYSNPFLSNSFPFYMTVEQSGLTHGVYMEASYPMEININRANILSCKIFGGNFQIHIFDGPSPFDVTRQLRGYLQVKPQPLPYWALGFHMCRDGDEYVHEVVWQNMTERNISFDGDCIQTDLVFKNRNTLDLEVITGIKTLQGNDRKFWLQVSPQVKVSAEFDHLDAFVMKKGERFRGVYKGEAVYYIDPWRKDAYEMYQQLFTTLNVDIDGVIVTDNQPYNSLNPTSPGPQVYIPDMEEANSFSSFTVAEDAEHGNGKPHLEVHNSYSAAHLRLLRRYFNEARPDQRTPILSECSSLISSGLGGSWSAGLKPSWGTLKSSVSNLIISSISGIPYLASPACGTHDISPESTTLPGTVCMRWHQTFMFSPLYFTHTGFRQRPREPVNLPGTLPKEVSQMIMMRYSIVPYIYTYTLEFHQQNKPFIYPLFFEFPQDEHAQHSEHGFMFGPFIYVSPIVELNPPDEIYFPKGCWYDFVTFSKMSCSKTGAVVRTASSSKYARVFFRGGAVIAGHSRLERTISESRSKEFELWVILNENWRAEGQLVLDDGILPLGHPSYRNTRITITYKSSVLTIQREESDFEAIPRTSTVIGQLMFLGLTKSPVNVTVEGVLVNEWDFNADLFTLSITDLNIDFGVNKKTRVKLIFDWS